MTSEAVGLLSLSKMYNVVIEVTDFKSEVRSDFRDCLDSLEVILASEIIKNSAKILTNHQKIKCSISLMLDATLLGPNLIFT